ncbi:TolB family protein [Phytohabitans kaempferiae]|uniref:TolB family protein n=1 Tax=Phytohabitans kaempferiae TaxID=1620943 RepID=A0ABV6LZ76_9ACTN
MLKTAGVRRSRWLRAVCLCAVTLAVAGCGAVAPRALEAISPRAISSVAWSNDGWIYFIEDLYDAPDELWRQRPGGRPEPLSLASEACAEPTYQFFSRGADGTMVAARDCGSGKEPGTELVTVVDGEVTASLARFPEKLSHVAWDPRTNQGFVSRSNEVNACWSLAPANGGGVGRFQSELSVDGRHWWADAYFRLGRQLDCTTMGDAGWPAVDSTGQRLYFFASGAAAGVSDTDDRRLSASWLCAMTVADQGVRTLASGFTDVRATTVSGDDSAVVVSVARSGDSGLWLIRPEGGAVQKLAGGLFGALSVAPDGKRVVAIEHGNRDDLKVVTLS